jgi:predicted oxidoreductase
LYFENDSVVIYNYFYFGVYSNMKTIVLGNSELVSSRLMYGCMRISGDNSPADREKGKQAIRAAIEAGYTHFDHADVYGSGASETLFAEVLGEMPGVREKLLITGKCGIRVPGDPNEGDPKRYDFSRQYIVDSVDQIFKRLGVEYLDLLLLHRPDFLFSPEDVAGTFDILEETGKVRHFGVSNFRPSQVSMLQAYCSMPLLANQVEVNIDNMGVFSDGTLDQCQELNISPMAWCPLGGVVYPAWGQTLTEEQSSRIQAELAIQAERYETEHWIVILAWLLKHPSGMLPIVGSTQPARIRAARKALDLDYSAVDWYRLLEARNGQEVP